MNKVVGNRTWDIILAYEVGLVISGVESNFTPIVDECVDFSSPRSGCFVAVGPGIIENLIVCSISPGIAQTAIIFVLHGSTQPVGMVGVAT